jgi:acyl-coenzyme A synthetase/AMP-(fatty) acid ligase
MGVEFVSELAKTASVEIQRALLRRQARDGGPRRLVSQAPGR